MRRHPSCLTWLSTKAINTPTPWCKYFALFPSVKQFPAGKKSEMTWRIHDRFFFAVWLKLHPLGLMMKQWTRYASGASVGYVVIQAIGWCWCSRCWFLTVVEAVSPLFSVPTRNEQSWDGRTWVRDGTMNIESGRVLCVGWWYKRFKRHVYRWQRIHAALHTYDHT